MRRARWERITSAVAVSISIATAAVAAYRVPATEGGWLPGGLLLLALAARELRRRTAPRAYRA